MKLKKCIVCNNKETTFLYTNSAMMDHSNKEYNFFICKICNLVFLNPRPSLKELKRYYTDIYLPYRGSSAWGKYKKLVDFSQQRLDIKRAKLLKQYSSPNKASSILDIGCGKPTFLETCNHFFKSSLYGIDFSNNGWKREQDRFKKLNLKVGDIDVLEKNFSPDIITLWHYLEHDYYPNKTLKKLASISNINTTLYIEVPNYDSLSRKKYAQNWAGFHTPRHTFLFSPKNIEILLNKNGWQVELIDLKGTLNPYVLDWMSEMEKKGIRWDKNMEDEFIQFVIGMIKFLPKKLHEKTTSLGIMTVVASPQ